MSEEQQPRDLTALLTLFTFAKKRDLERYARKLVLRPGEFVDVILACEQGLLPFKHRAHYSRVERKGLPSPIKEPSGKEGGARPQLDLRKVLTIWNRMKHESRWAAGHLFYTPGFYEWHFFIFDRLDQESESPNHWREGAHMHFVNWLWPALEPRAVWADFVKKRKKPGSSLHIRDESDDPGE